MDILTVFALAVGLLALLWLAWIDAKLWILPNELVLLFACAGIGYHLVADDPSAGGRIFMVAGALAGGGALYVIRAVANRIYGMETLGLGDVKLMAAGGIWLGAEAVLAALSIGAFAGILGALAIAARNRVVTGQKVSLNRMAIPAGPGFITGLIVSFILYNYGFL